MSKKKNKKFHRKKGHKIAVITQPSVIKKVSTETPDTDILLVETEENQSENLEIETASKETDFHDNKEYSHVKKDVKKILFLILVLAIIFVGIYFLGQKTSILIQFGDWIYKTAHIQTL